MPVTTSPIIVFIKVLRVKCNSCQGYDGLKVLGRWSRCMVGVYSVGQGSHPESHVWLGLSILVKVCETS